MSAISFPWAVDIDRVVTTPPIAGYVAYYDPTDTSTWTGTGQAVSALTDKSGNGNTLSVGSAVGEPMMMPSATQTSLSIPCRATATWVSNASLSDISMTAFIVACATYYGGSARIMINPSASGGFQFYVSAAGLLTTDSAGVANLGSMTIGPTLGTPFVAASILTSTTCRQYLNLTGETDAFGATSFTGGRTLQVSAGSWVGWIGKVLIYDTTLSNADAETTISYLMTDYGIT